MQQVDRALRPCLLQQRQNLRGQIRWRSHAKAAQTLPCRELLDCRRLGRTPERLQHLDRIVAVRSRKGSIGSGKGSERRRFVCVFLVGAQITKQKVSRSSPVIASRAAAAKPTPHRPRLARRRQADTPSEARIADGGASFMNRRLVEDAPSDRHELVLRSHPCDPLVLGRAAADR